MTESKKNKRSPTDLDQIIGKNCLKFRELRGLTQEDMADHLGITFQQVQKYEKATNRIAASRLFEIAKILEISPQELIQSHPFYEDAPESFFTKENIRIFRAIEELSSPKQKDLALQLIKTLATS